MKKTIIIGQTKHRQDIEIDVELRDTPHGKELSICGAVWKETRSDIIEGGQCLDRLEEQVRFWNGAWNREKFRSVVALWKRWHLNGMRSACEHQRSRGETYKTHPSAQCPDCGYKLGHAWLHETLPNNVLAEIRMLLDSEEAVAA